MTQLAVEKNDSVGAPIRLAPFAMVILLLVAIVLANQFLLWWFTESGRRQPWQYSLYFAVFVFQVGLVGFVCGRFVPGVIGWIVFGWCLFLTDLLTFCMAVSYPYGREASGTMLGSALLSGQIGTIVVWGVLGEQRWGLRVPIAASAALALLLLWSEILDQLTYRDKWDFLLSFQSIILCSICVVLRSRYCRLQQTLALPHEANDLAAPKRWQFNLKEVFIQTTTIAALMGAFRATVSLQKQTAGFSLLAFSAEVVLACLLAVMMLVALWAVFDDRKWWVRLGVLILSVGILGGGISWACIRLEQWAYRQSFNYWDYMTFVYPKAWWLPWTFLATGFLVATLWIFRIKGYRLVKV